ncbi:MAG: Z1 domain-containing protein [Hyphomonas sp.]
MENIDSFLSDIQGRMRKGGVSLEVAARAAENEIVQKLVGAGIGSSDNVNSIQGTIAAAVEQLRAESAARLEYVKHHAVVRRDNFTQWYIAPGDKQISPRWWHYREQLESRSGWAGALESIDRDSTSIVSRLPCPITADLTGCGLVLGHVQSGKTANMMAVISKAADAGYKLIIVLAGLTRALRRQTQSRIEKDLLHGTEEGLWYSHTKSCPADQPDIDFKGLAEERFQHLAPVQIAVVKKNVSPLKLLLTHFRNTSQINKERLPVLIIDDECDQASVNAANSEYDTTAINRLIREIIAQLPKCAYVGYTATPFANVLIDPEVQPASTEDLYPRDFVFPLETSDDYFGPEKLFGRDQLDADDESPDADGYDMIRIIPDDETPALRPKREDKETFEAVLPESLHEALNYYLLALAARRARGQSDKHASMLVHSTLYTASHRIIRNAIETDWLEPVRLKLREGNRDYLRQLDQIWANESGKVSAADFNNPALVFDELKPHLHAVASNIELAVENMDSEERLDYDGDDARTYIVVGGSVLARGLTIEGLTVSYFTRPSKQFDSLLQMGRWFGYRPGFEDLPRIWMTAELEASFHALATIEAEIRHDVHSAIVSNLTPADLAVRIRMIPGMKATSANKLRKAVDHRVSFASKHVQTRFYLPGDEAWLRQNWKAGEQLIAESLEAIGLDTVPDDRVLRDVPFAVIEQFLSDGMYQIHPDQESMKNEDILGYIRTADTDDRNRPKLHTWNVAIVEPSRTSTNTTPQLGRAGTVMTHRRSRLAGNISPADIKALMSAADLWTDCRDIRDSSIGKWDDIKARRREHQIETIGEERPLLLLYPIDPESSPQNRKKREVLGAVSDVLGIGILFPYRDEPTGYLVARLIEPEADLDVDEEFEEETAGAREEETADR